MKFPQIIDNRSPETRLDFVLNNIILPFAEDVRIAVGYFYLSGYQLLLDGLRARAQSGHGRISLKIVMSPRTDRSTAAVLSIGHRGIQGGENVHQTILRTFEVDLASASLEAAEELVKDLTSGAVEVKLCVDDFFHAKAYLARTVAGNIDHHYSIVGSSNFSAGGLTDNHELNLGTEEAANYSQLVEWFDEIWERKSVPFNESLIRIMESSIAARKRSAQGTQRPLSPFAMLLFRVRHYLGDLVEEQLRDSDQLAEFQRIGAENVLDKLERLGGAIVSDSVGLGKTYTAGEVIRRYRGKRKKVLIVTPPYVLSQWRQTLSAAFGVPESSEVVFLSQGKLAQMKDSQIEKDLQRQNFDLIVVDEAHRARNTETQLHRNLRALQRGGQESHVLLLTATPFNNSVGDLDSLVHLAVLKNRLTNSGFAPDSFRTLRDHFRKLKTGANLADLEKDPSYVTASQQVREILNAVMLLRMRSTIKDRYKQVSIAGKPLIFEDPVVRRVAYQYAGKHHKVFENLIDFLGKLHLPHIDWAIPIHPEL